MKALVTPYTPKTDFGRDGAKDRGAVIRLLRVGLDLSLRESARALGLRDAVLGYIERGITTIDLRDFQTLVIRLVQLKEAKRDRPRLDRLIQRFRSRELRLKAFDEPPSFRPGLPKWLAELEKKLSERKANKR